MFCLKNCFFGNTLKKLSIFVKKFIIKYKGYTRVDLEVRTKSGDGKYFRD